MKKPKARVVLREAGSDFVELVIQGSTELGSEVATDFGAQAEKHSLPPEGGCFLVVARTADGGKVTLLGGLKVQRTKYREVVSELRHLGYEVGD